MHVGVHLQASWKGSPLGNHTKNLTSWVNGHL